MLTRRVCRRDRLPRREDWDLRKGTTATSGGRSPHLKEARIADHGKESVRPEGGGVLSAAR